MRLSLTLCYLMLVVMFAGCDLRSETAKREMEKFSGTPTPTLAPSTPELPVDPSEIITADISMQGEMITVNGHDLKKTAACTKFNRVMISGGRNVITIKGACQLITINGDGNRIISDAALQFVINGTNNTVNYSLYVNGKRPNIKENASGNTIEKIPAGTTK
ncbi:MAG: DUF3060 domain-containing protein [Acidobacteria bacterium]|nr:DUF3060 domain-containing protein [Acidobacteriota bacterium]